MLMNIGSTVRVACDLILQPVDVPEFGRCGMRVEEIVYAQRRAPIGGKRVMDIQVGLAKSLAVDLTQGRRGVGARGGHVWEVVDGRSVVARTGRQGIVPEITVAQ